MGGGAVRGKKTGTHVAPDPGAWAVGTGGRHQG